MRVRAAPTTRVGPAARVRRPRPAPALSCGAGAARQVKHARGDEQGDDVGRLPGGHGRAVHLKRAALAQRVDQHRQQRRVQRLRRQAGLGVRTVVGSGALAQRVDQHRQQRRVQRRGGAGRTQDQGQCLLRRARGRAQPRGVQPCTMRAWRLTAEQAVRQGVPSRNPALLTAPCVPVWGARQSRRSAQVGSTHAALWEPLASGSAGRLAAASSTATQNGTLHPHEECHFACSRRGRRAAGGGGPGRPRAR